MNSIYKQNLNFRVRKIAKQSILFGEGSKAYTLNETGNIIWNQMRGDKGIQDICNDLIKQYDNVNEQDIQTDVDCFIDFLISIGAINLVK